MIAIDPPVAFVLEPPVGRIRVEDGRGQTAGGFRGETQNGETDPLPAVFVSQIATLLQLEDQRELIGIPSQQGLSRLFPVEFVESGLDLRPKKSGSASSRIAFFSSTVTYFLFT